jgi:hypothetical protein
LRKAKPYLRNTWLMARYRGGGKNRCSVKIRGRK